MKYFGLCTIVMIGLSAHTVADVRSADKTTLSIDGAVFVVNGKHTFLLGMSYYAGLGATSKTWKYDLDQMKRCGFNWLRVFATWAAFDNDISAVDPDGNPREPHLKRLRDLVAECNRRGLIVDVTLSRGNGKNRSPHLMGYESHRRAIETIVTALKPWRNWYLDLSNERNIGDARHTPMADLAKLRQVVKRLDPERLVTASHGGDISRKELANYINVAQLDFVCPHRPRSERAAEMTAAITRELLVWMSELSNVVPVHYQEPLRRGYADWQPTAAEIAADLKAAREGGAAGWCIHNGSTKTNADGRPRRSFDMRDGPLFKQLDSEELRFIRGMGVW